LDFFALSTYASAYNKRFCSTALRDWNASEGGRSKSGADAWYDERLETVGTKV